jgi:hypothetical protein
MRVMATPSYTPRRPAPVDPDTHAPHVPWTTLLPYLRTNFIQGDHVSIFGPTGVGKTHLAFDIAEIRTYVLTIATKPHDELVDDALKRGYYRVQTDDLRIDYVDNVPLHKHVIYWPQLSPAQARKVSHSGRIQARKKFQKPRVQAAMGYIDLNGHWCLLIDEGTWVYKDLRLAEDVDSALTQWRSSKASIIILGQRPAWMGRYTLSMPTHIFLFHTANVEDAKSLGNIGGVDTKLIRELVQNLDRDAHEFLYLDLRHHKMFRSIAPPK